jgi:O-antigen/teichoic acid export membrane protein
MDITKIIKHSSIYMVSSILNKSIPFLLLPIMTKYLSPQEYGLLSVFLIFITLFSAFISMNMSVNISKNFFKITHEKLAILIGNILFILFCATLFYFFITFFIFVMFDELFSIATSFMLIIPFIVAMDTINTLNTTILRNNQKVFIYAVFEISNTLIKMSSTILFLLVFDFGWFSQVIGMAVGSILFMIISIFYMYKRNYINININSQIIKSILHISVPMIPHLVGGAVIAMSDRLFIESMISLEAVGLYSVGYMFGMVVMLFTDAFIKAWSPWFYKSLVNPTDSKKEKIVKYTYIYIVVIFILAIFISIAGTFVLPYFVDEKFYGASEFILWISLGYAVQGVYKIIFPYLVHISKTSFLAFSTVTAAILNLLFNYILINEFGTIGAAYATILAFAVSAFLVFWYQNRHYYMPWK